MLSWFQKHRERPDFARIETLGQDLAYAFRLFRRAPGFTALVILTLTLGIGANTAVFSILDSVLLQPLPYRDSNRLAVVWDRQIHEKGTSKIFDLYSDYENWRRNSRQFEDIAAVSWAGDASPGKILTGRGPARSIFTLPVTANFFDLLGVPALRGRTFTSADAGGACKVVLTYRFWQTAFDARETAIGSPIHLNDQVCTIAGVMPAGFAFLPPGAPVTMWTILPRPPNPDEFSVAVFGRLRPQVSLKSAQAEISLLHHRLHRNDHWGARMEPVLYDLHEEFTWLTGRNLRLSLYVLFAAVSFVLLICCVNVANLLLGRAVGREREMAIRASLGSGRLRLLRQLLTENLLLSVLASATGALLAAAIVSYFREARPVELPPGVTPELSAPVLGFAVFLSIVTCLLFGLIPAWRASRTDLQTVLKSGASRSSSQDTRQQRFGKQLIILEVAMTAVLVTGAGLLIQTVQRFGSAPLGFQPAGLVTTGITLPPNGYSAPERRRAFFANLQSGLASLPGVESLALSSSRPIDGGGVINVVMVEGHPAPRIDHPADTFSRTVTPNYFAVLHIPLKTGRYFNPGDSGEAEPVVIVNEVLVREYIGDENPIGKHIRIFDENQHNAPWMRIVGVVGDEKRTSVYQEMAWADPPLMYRPLAQDPMVSANIVARVSATASLGKLSNQVQQRTAELDPNIPVEALVPVTDIESKATSYPRFRAALLAAFAGLGLLLAAVGLFGVLSYAVAQRRQEIGIRMALGAEKSAVVFMILKEGLLLTGGGILTGSIASWGLDRYLSALLYGVRPDPVLFVVTASVLIPVALIAMYIPVRRAVQIDPMSALRYE